VESTQEESVNGKFKHLIFSPKGSVEGVLLDVDRKPAQIVFARRDGASSGDFASLKKGQKIVVQAIRQGPSPKGPSDHAVFGYVRLVSVDGRKPVKRAVAAHDGYTGVVKRFNYARHGEPNGVVLNTGIFVHTKPQGLAALKLKVGDKISAEGNARALQAGGGQVVEAVMVNGKRIRP
jgi:hypothetical protein